MGNFWQYPILMKRLYSLLPSLCLGTTIAVPVNAQIITDGSTNTTVTTTDNVIRIENGSRAGDNLFHSFGEFSVPTGSEAFFNNALDVVNIFSRVTGGKISHIDGLIRANGGANLFLINPHGIIFGNNASLQIGGSFYGSTADSIIFADGVEFAASNPVKPLLTINAPIGLRFRDNPGDIVNQSVAGGVGLRVAPGENLALIGGNILLEGGKITASLGKGNIELGSVTGNSVVNLEPANSRFDPGYDGVTNFGEISLTQDATITTSEASISLQGDRISLAHGSQISSVVAGSEVGGDISINARELAINNRANITTATRGEGDAGNINVDVMKSIEIVGTGFDEFQEVFIRRLFDIEDPLDVDTILNNGIGIFSATDGTGAAGNVTINTSQLQLREGGIIGSSTNSEGASGSLTINTSDSLEIDGSGIINNPLLGSRGDGNILQINTSYLTILDGGLISSGTLGEGHGGDITINASGQIDILRTLPDSLVATGIFSSTGFGNGAAGNITINTQRLNIEDRGRISSTSGIATRQGIINRGGAGGAITINSSESIEISGGSSGNVLLNSAIASSSFTNNDAGEINITTSNLDITDGGQISVDSIGQGNGGALSIFTDSLTLDNGFIIANTNFGRGADVNLFVANHLILDNNSQISAVASGNADGGNVNIESSVIIAFASQIPGNGNDIIASAEQGDGGEILVRADAILGIEPRNATPGNATNDLDASSESGPNLISENFVVDTNLSEANVVESNQVADRICQANQTTAENTNTFIIKGKGGVPPAPNLALSGEVLLHDGQTIIPNNSQLHNHKTTYNITPPIQPVKTSVGDIYPARGFIKTEDGRIILTPYPTAGTVPRVPDNLSQCQQKDSE